MIYDQHCHSSYSGDSYEDIENYFKIADSCKVEYLVTTEHIEFNSVYNNQDWTVDYENLIKDLNKYHLKYPHIKPLLGIELGYRKDQLDRMIKIVNKYHFDIINMSIHDNGIYDYYLKDNYKQIGVQKMLDIYFNNIIDSLDNFNDFDVLSHFDYGFKTAYLVDSSLKIDDYEPIVRRIFRKLIKLNKALEINIKVQTTINDINHMKTFLNWYKSEGGTKITLSSDSHNKDSYSEYYKDQDKYIKIIKEIGFNYLCYFIKRKENHYYI